MLTVLISLENERCSKAWNTRQIEEAKFIFDFVTFEINKNDKIIPLWKPLDVVENLLLSVHSARSPGNNIHSNTEQFIMKASSIVCSHFYFRCMMII